jgi:hypothetical protein
MEKRELSFFAVMATCFLTIHEWPILCLSRQSVQDKIKIAMQDGKSFEEYLKEAEIFREKHNPDGPLQIISTKIEGTQNRQSESEVLESKIKVICDKVDSLYWNNQVEFCKFFNILFGHSKGMAIHLFTLWIKERYPEEEKPVEYFILKLRNEDSILKQSLEKLHELSNSQHLEDVFSRVILNKISPATKRILGKQDDLKDLENLVSNLVEG